MGLLILLAVLLLAGFAVAGMMRTGRLRDTPSLPPHDTALELLRERYARGEIDRDTYERMRNDLRG
ncbi:MAG: SHOCT domain-containing protein [Acidihalobacter sp.]|jgi:putative membrane protein